MFEDKPNGYYQATWNGKQAIVLIYEAFNQKRCTIANLSNGTIKTIKNENELLKIHSKIETMNNNFHYPKAQFLSRFKVVTGENATELDRKLVDLMYKHEEDWLKNLVDNPGKFFSDRRYMDYDLKEIDGKVYHCLTKKGYTIVEEEPQKAKDEEGKATQRLVALSDLFIKTIPVVKEMYLSDYLKVAWYHIDGRKPTIGLPK